MLAIGITALWQVDMANLLTTFSFADMGAAFRKAS
jgi:hypothetical protein